MYRFQNTTSILFVLNINIACQEELAYMNCMLCLDEWKQMQGVPNRFILGMRSATDVQDA